MNSETFVAMSESNTASIRVNWITYMFAATALLAIMVFGDTGDFQFPLTMGLIGAALYGMFTFDFDMQTATSLRDSMPEEVASSKAEEGYSKAPFTIYRLVNAAVLTLIAVAQISVIFQNGQSIQMCCSVKASSQAAKGQPWPGGKSSIESTLLFLHGFRGERGYFHFGKV